MTFCLRESVRASNFQGESLDTPPRHIFAGQAVCDKVPSAGCWKNFHSGLSTFLGGSQPAGSLALRFVGFSGLQGLLGIPPPPGLRTTFLGRGKPVPKNSVAPSHPLSFLGFRWLTHKLNV